MASHLRLERLDLSIAVHRSGRARRITLTVPKTGAAPRLTAPPHVGVAELRMFLLRHENWLQDALARAPREVRIADGAPLPVSGRLFRLKLRPEERGHPPRIDGEFLVLDGPGAPGARAAAWLKERARAAIAPIAVEAAAEFGGRMGKLSFRDQKGRWGSCTNRGDLSFSWRLAMAPPEALDYVAVHEAAHLIEMNHGPRFWALVARLRPDWKRQRDWLRTKGPELHRYNFSAPGD